MPFHLFGIQDPDGDNLGWGVYKTLPTNELADKKIISDKNDGFFRAILLGSCSDPTVIDIESARQFWKKAISEIETLKPLERQKEVYPRDEFIISYMNGYEIGGLKPYNKSLSIDMPLFWFKLGQKAKDENKPPLFRVN